MAPGEAKSDFWWLLKVLGLLGLVWLATGGYRHPEATSGPLISPPERVDPSGQIVPSEGSTILPTGSSYAGANSVGGNVPTSAHSSYFGQFSINQGNAQYETQANREYISISYQGSAPVDLTGWHLTNGKGERTYEVNGSAIHLNSDVVVIPRVTKLFLGGGNNAPNTNLLMTKGGQVFITSGSLPSTGYFPPVLNFQTNLCSGYLEEMEDTNFSPSLWSACPAPRDWPGVRSVANECYQYLTSVGACRTPKFEMGTDGLEYLDGRPSSLSSACQNFVKQNLNYNGCVATFSARADFYKNEWRIYLNRPWELWASDRETITLYDRNNQIVAQTRYGN